MAGLNYAGPGDRSPIEQWYEARHIDGFLRPKVVDESCAVSLLDAAARCARWGLVMPRWLAERLTACVRKVVDFEVRTLDEAFGHPLKSRKISALRRQKDISDFVYGQVLIYASQNPGQAIDRLLHDDVAERIHQHFASTGIRTNGAEVERIYHLAIANGQLEARCWVGPQK